MPCTCLKTNEVFRTDPTRTLTIRRRFEADVNRRFRRLIRDINTSVIENDVFGLSNTNPLLNEPAIPGQFAFSTSAQKVDGFMSWLRSQEAGGLLELTSGPALGNQPWSNIYIDSAYQQGIRRSQAELRKAGVDIPEFSASSNPIAASMNQPIHAERVALAFTRTYDELKGVTEAMNQQMSRVLAQGLMDGKGQREIARMLVDRVEKIGRTRARTIARTEVIRAHHTANMGEYRMAGLEGVKVKAEWSTAGFGVCPDCASLEGQVFTMDKIEGLIPLHPNCRCIALPLLPGDQPDPSAGESIIGDEYRRADGTIRPVSKRVKGLVS